MLSLRTGLDKLCHLLPFHRGSYLTLQSRHLLVRRKRRHLGAARLVGVLGYRYSFARSVFDFEGFVTFCVDFGESAEVVFRSALSPFTLISSESFTAIIKRVKSVIAQAWSTCLRILGSAM